MPHRLLETLAWLAVAAVVGGCLAPVWAHWNTAVVAPFGGIDALLQLGLLEWSARHWTAPATWTCWAMESCTSRRETFSLATKKRSRMASW